MMTKQDLMEKRHNTDQLRQNSSLSPLHAEQLGQSIASSWQRSSSAEIPKNRLAAPLTDLKKTTSSSTLAQALQHCAQDLKHIAEQSSMVLAVGDIGSTIIWAASSPQMQSAAESVHFIEGG